MLGKMRGKTLPEGVVVSERIQPNAASDRGPPGDPADLAEHLSRDLARVRANFGADPVLAGRSLEMAWKSEAAVEEDEAEFVDTVADCLGAGLSLEDALSCWDTGDLVYQAADHEVDEGGAGEGDADDTVPIVQPPPRRSPAGHRVLVR